MSLVRAFEEQSADQGHQSLIKEESKFAGELGTSLDLSSLYQSSATGTERKYRW